MRIFHNLIKMKKSHAQEIVKIVRRLYSRFLSEESIGKKLGWSRSFIHSIMEKNNIKRRISYWGVKEYGYQKGQKHPLWKGNEVGYKAAHDRIGRYLGKPSKCEVCGTIAAKRFEWANMSGKFYDVKDYKRMCCSCHRRHDGAILNIKKERL